MTAHMGQRNVRERGFTLIELMISLVLGLLVVAAASAIFMSNKRTFATTETLGRLQENARSAFELMGRDVREAGGNPCSSRIPINNVLNSSATTWWANFNLGIRGYASTEAMPGTPFGSGVGSRVNGTDAIDISNAMDGDVEVVVKMPQPSANIEVSTVAGLAQDDIAMICDLNTAVIFQITQLPSGTSVQHNSGTSAPGNCTKDFVRDQVLTKCNNSGTGYLFGDDARVVLPRTYRWYIGPNGRGGTSLYRATVVNKTTTETPDMVNAAEIAEGASAMRLEYLLDGASDYVPAAATLNWRSVVAVRASVEYGAAGSGMGGSYQQGTDGKVLQRSTAATFILRNRIP